MKTDCYCYNCGVRVLCCIHGDCPEHCDLCKSNESLREWYGTNDEYLEAQEKKCQ